MWLSAESKVAWDIANSVTGSQLASDMSIAANYEQTLSR